MTDTEKLEAIREYMKVISKNIDANRATQRDESNSETRIAYNQGCADKALNIKLKLESILDNN